MIQRAEFADRPTRRPIGSSTGPGWAIFGIALASRVGYVLAAAGFHPQPYSDSLDYDQIAWNLARGLGFSLGESGSLYPTAFRPPLVPWLTSLLYRSMGHHYLGALLLQAVIGALVAVLLMALGSAMFGGAVGRLAGWLAAFHPLLVFFSGYLLTETAFCAALLAALLASVSWVKTPRPGRAFGAGMLWGLATLARPPALLVPALIAMWAWRPLGLTIRSGDRIRQLAALALGVSLVVGPWTIRNAVVLHAFIPVTTGGGRALLDSNNDVIWSDPARRGGATNVYGIEPYASAFRGHSESECDAIAGGLALDFLRRHASEWPAMVWAKFTRFWRLSAEGGGTGNWQREGSPLAVLRGWLDPLRLWSLPFLPLACWGLVRSLRGPRRWFQSAPALLIAYFMLNALVFWGSLRTRVPIEPMVTLLAAIGLDDLRRRWRVQRLGLGLVGAKAEGRAAVS